MVFQEDAPICVSEEIADKYAIQFQTDIFFIPPELQEENNDPSYRVICPKFPLVHETSCGPGHHHPLGYTSADSRE